MSAKGVVLVGVVLMSSVVHAQTDPSGGICDHAADRVGCVNKWRQWDAQQTAKHKQRKMEIEEAERLDAIDVLAAQQDHNTEELYTAEGRRLGGNDKELNDCLIKAAKVWRTDLTAKDICLDAFRARFKAQQQSVADAQKAEADLEVRNWTDRKWLSDEYCVRWEQRDNDISQIKRERSNAHLYGGVIDLELLHDLQDDIADMDAELKPIVKQLQKLKFGVPSPRVCRLDD